MASSSLNPITPPLDNSQLIDGCQHCLTQCETLLEQLSRLDYLDCAGGSSVGTHIRHVLERFQSFFDGLPEAYVDYDRRRRDSLLETDPAAASEALSALAAQLSDLDLVSDPKIGIRVHESVYHAGPAVTILSTVPRELMSLITHTTHHLAIIKLLVKPLGYSLESDFGKAASTIRFERDR